MIKKMNAEQTAKYQALVPAAAIPGDTVFALLGKVQDSLGCIPASVITDLAARSGLPAARIFGAVTAYPDFTLTED